MVAQLKGSGIRRRFAERKERKEMRGRILLRVRNGAQNAGIEEGGGGQSRLIDQLKHIITVDGCPPPSALIVEARWCRMLVAEGGGGGGGAGGQCLALPRARITAASENLPSTRACVPRPPAASARWVAARRGGGRGAGRVRSRGRVGLRASGARRARAKTDSTRAHLVGSARGCRRGARPGCASREQVASPSAKASPELESAKAPETGRAFARAAIVIWRGLARS